MGNRSTKASADVSETGGDQPKMASSQGRALRIKGVASDSPLEDDTSLDIANLREQRLRLSLDVEGEQLPAIGGKRTPRLPQVLQSELAKPAPIAAKSFKKPKTPKGTLKTLDKLSADNSIASNINSNGLLNKKLQGVSEASPVLNFTYGTFSLAGWEPVRELRDGQQARKENQDAFCCYERFGGRSEEAFFGVFDGHGARGRAVAEFVRDILPTVLDSQLKDLSKLSDQEDAKSTETTLSEGLDPSMVTCTELKGKHQLDIVKAAIQGFIDCSKILNSSDSNVDTFMSGTTAVVAWLYQTLLFCCNLGDSRCVIGRQCSPHSVSRMAKEKYMAVEMSYDQKPSRTDETQRVVAAGGRVASWQTGIGPLRVWLADEWIPGLAMTRSFGDSLLHSVGVSEIPEVTCIQLSEMDKFCVLASDGVWEFMSSQEVVDFLGKYRRKCSAQEAAESLVQEAVKRWRKNELVVDDVTAIVIWLDCKVASPNPAKLEPSAVSDVASGYKSSSVGGFWHSWKIWSSLGTDSTKSNCFGYQPVLIEKNGTLKPFLPQNHEA
ncbi:protein phosphatase 2C isoform 1 [Galdieria sulphuraria]|uniref:Protein phosphatase 2C isoform 1 n=1 Tax=Galdieria sulphuraria TaxID=130081 RepID=M2XH22_GALSU|nr:protein phosphatase 2C isoform 1 [Galdieria sulphuraria]EME29352.1 protein phosphatase 2C isoform 1 [Galdieria sulphuraria]|eukprot:XP_005705872.1 protein phosphatase 2C isoform 1 [Galdieria sulphuraria]